MRSPRIAPYFFLAPAAFSFLLLVILPIILSFRLSFFENDGLGYSEFIGLDNYFEMLDDDIVYRALFNNFLWLIFFLLAPVFGLGLALFLNQKIRGIKVVKSLFFFPFVISAVVVGMVFSWFYDPNYGLMIKLFGAFLPENFNILGNEYLASFGIIFAGLWPQTAYCLIIYLAGLTAIDSEQIEAARMDGAKGTGMLFNIILPQLSAATFIALVVTIIGALRSFDLIAIMTDGGPYDSSQVLSLYMYQQAVFSQRVGYGSAIAVLLFLIMSVFIFFFIRHMIKQERG
ncbi:MAG: carbohydrate ABC transporter permease [Alphaproteobacteria bacterium]